jgi:hypothetical protein
MGAQIEAKAAEINPPGWPLVAGREESADSDWPSPATMVVGQFENKPR